MKKTFPIFMHTPPESVHLKDEAMEWGISRIKDLNFRAYFQDDGCKTTI